MLIGSDDTTSPPTVTVGSRVRVSDPDYGVESYRVVAAEDSDPARQAISEDCALAQALLGHRPGDRVRIQAPFGNRYVTVLDVVSQS